MPTFVDRNLHGVPGLNIRSSAGVIRFETPDLAWTTTSGHRVLFANAGNNLIWDNGTTQITLASATGVATTFEQIFANDTTLAMTATGLTMSQTANAMVLTLTKTGTGAGSPLVINNAGTGADLTLNNTNGGAAGVIMVSYFNSATPADADVIFEHTVQGEDDGGGTETYGRVRFISDDVSAATEDATYQLALDVAGTLSTCLAITGPTVTVGDGTSNATITTSGALDLILSTNAGTDSGTIRIYDAAGGNIEVLPNGTGDLTVPTSGIVLGGTTPTRCSFATAGTTGDSFLITTSTITSGDVLAVDHTANATLAGGNLLNLLVDSVSVFSVGESGVTTIVGVAGSNVLSITAGDIVGSDTSLTLTDADNAATLSVTNNTATTAQVFLVTGSGVFTGTGATAFFGVTQSGATSGDVVAVTANGLTTGNALLLTSTGTIVDGGAMLSIVADSATTAGATSGGLIELSADALTTGIACDITSTSLNLAAGGLFNVAHTASGTLAVAKTGYLTEVFSSRTHTAATAISDDYDVVSVVRTNVVNNAGGTLNAAGSCIRIANTSTQTAGTLEDTAIGLEIVFTGGAESQGNAIDITHSGTTVGRAINVAASQTTRDGVVQLTCNAVTTGNAMVLDCNGLTTGIGLEVTHTTSVITTGSVVRITSTGIDTGTGQGTLLDLVSSGATAAEVVSLVADALTTGIGFFTSFDGLTTGEGVSITHTTSVIADGGSLFRLSSTGIDTGGATNGALLDLSSTAQAAGVVALLTANGLTTGTALRVTSSGTMTSAGEGLVNIVGTGITTGSGLKIDLTEATLTTGFYINCYDDTATATVFSVAENGALTITGAAASTAITVTAGDITTADGAMASAIESITLGAAAATFVADSNYIRLTGDAGGNSVTTITGGLSGQILVVEFRDALVTIVNDNTDAANTIDLIGANTTFAADATLTLGFNGTSWKEITRSINA